MPWSGADRAWPRPRASTLRYSDAAQRAYRRGIAFGLLATLMTAVMNTLISRATPRIPLGEVVFARSVAGIAILGVILGRDIRRLAGARAAPAWIFGIAGTISILCLFWNLRHANPGTAYALFCLSPVFVLIISWSVFGERIPPHAVAGMVCACAGALLFNAVRATTPSIIVVLVGLMGAFAAGIGYTSLRRSAQKVPPALNVFALSLVMLAGTATTAGQWTAPTAPELAALVAIGILSVSQLVFTARSFSSLPAAVASGVALTSMLWTVVFALPFGVVPAAIELLAYALVLLGVTIINVQQQGRLQRVDPLVDGTR
jgi:drug/metabolite transporter (DMT)-like permease